MGFAVLFVLSALAGFAALAITTRARLRGRAEVVVAATTLWNALIIAPIYAVGLTNRLTARSVGLGSLVTSLAAIALASQGLGLRALARDTVRAFVGILRLPFEALALSARPFRFVFVGVLFAALLLPYLAVSAYLGQALSKWDPLWYHDTMVGFAIQNHGFAMVDLPPTLQKVNGYVRLGEMTQLWLVIFSDRRLADLTNVLFAPAIVAATYALARRYTSRVVALGWGVATLLMPCCAGYLQSTFVDPQNAALILCGILFSTHERPRLRDGLLAAVGLALGIGSKGIALATVPVIGAVGAFGLLRAHWHQRRRDAVAVVVGGALLIIATAATTYLRNYLAFHNPLWPDLRVDIPKLGIHWPGEGPWASSTPGNPGGLPVNLNESLPKLLDHLFALPWSVKGMFFDQAVEFGIGVVWVALPLGALGFVMTLVAALRRRLGHFSEDEREPPLALALILAAVILGSPALWGARYHTQTVAVLVVFAAWVTRRPAWQRLEEPAVSMLIVTSLMMFWWQPEPRWWMTPERLVALAHRPVVERELDRDLGASTMLAPALAREKELTAGKLLVFDEHYAGFPSLFWNTTFSNRVRYIKGGPGFLSRAAEAGATWIFLTPQDSQFPAAQAPGSGWQEVGQLNAVIPGYAFRRIPPPPPVTAPVRPPPPLPPLPPMLGPPAPHAR
jgi:hypothetical protein